jgi:hypothetical protein
VKKWTILAVALALVSIWVVLVGGGATMVWRTEELRVFGLGVVPTAIVASLLVLYFDWRRRLRRQILAEPDDGT